MDVIALTAKAVVAVLLLVAGGAKLADLPSFAAAVRMMLFFRLPRPAVRAAAVAAALAELALGAASLSLPAGWLNPLTFAFTCGFVAVSGVGFVFHRGRSCRCFGALSNRKFDALGIARAAAIAAAAAIAMTGVPPTTVALSSTARVLLLGAGGLVALAAYSAAHALGLARRSGLEA